MEIHNIFKALSDKNRLKIFYLVSLFDPFLNEIVRTIGISQPSVSKHMRILTDLKLIKKRREGTRYYFYVDKEFKNKNLFKEIFHEIQNNQEYLDIKKTFTGIRENEIKLYQNQLTGLAKKWDQLSVEYFDRNQFIKMIQTRIVKGIKNAVDIGCGTGESIRLLSIDGLKWTGVDRSQEMLNEAERKIGRYADLRIGDALHLPVKDEEFDLGLMMMVLHHIHHPEMVMIEAERIINQNGYLIIIDFDRHEDEMFRDQFYDFWLGFSREKLEQWIGKTSLKIKEYQNIKGGKDKKIHFYLLQKGGENAGIQN